MLESLMERCWAQLPGDRPSMADVVRQLKEPSYAMLCSSHDVLAAGELSAVCALPLVDSNEVSSVIMVVKLSVFFLISYAKRQLT